MRRIALLLPLLAGPPVLGAPAPLPRPNPRPTRLHWEIDFSPLAKAGMVNLSITLSIGAPAGFRRMQVSHTDTR